MESELAVSSFRGQRIPNCKADPVLSRFICLLYVPAWLTAPLAEKAAHKDLRLDHNLLRFRRLEKVVADVTLHNMHRYLFYLKPETVVLSLASELASADV